MTIIKCGHITSMTPELTQLHNLFMKSLNKIFTHFEVDTTDGILDHRDLTEFADLWTIAHQEIENNPIDSEDKNLIDQARKKIFMLTYSKTNSSDLSAYISEDFELIASHLLSKDQNTWVTSLCATYFSHTIPTGELAITGQTLKGLIGEQS